MIVPQYSALVKTCLEKHEQFRALHVKKHADTLKKPRRRAVGGAGREEKTRALENMIYKERLTAHRLLKYGEERKGVGNSQQDSYPFFTLETGQKLSSLNNKRNLGYELGRTNYKVCLNPRTD